MYRLAAPMVLACATSATAQTAIMSDCYLEYVHTSTAIHCDVENLSDTPIAAIQLEYELFEDGRTVPWVTLTPRTFYIAGGIEPSERLEVVLWIQPPPSKAPKDRLNVRVSSNNFIDVNGDEITANSSPSQ